MLEIERKPYKAIVFMDYESQADDKRVVVEEEFYVRFVLCESGEIVIGKTTKLTGKEIFVHIEGEIGDKVFLFTDIETIKEIDPDTFEEDAEEDYDEDAE